jgi:hypothetical protein
MAEEKIFAQGFSFKRNEKAPDFVIGRLSIKIDEATVFMKNNAKGGWVNLDVKKSKGGAYYIELDTFEPKQGGAPTQQPAKPIAKAATIQEDSSAEDDLPF